MRIIKIVKIAADQNVGAFGIPLGGGDEEPAPMPAKMPRRPVLAPRTQPKAPSVLPSPVLIPGGSPAPQPSEAVAPAAPEVPSEAPKLTTQPSIPAPTQVIPLPESIQKKQINKDEVIASKPWIRQISPGWMHVSPKLLAAITEKDIDPATKKPNTLEGFAFLAQANRSIPHAPSPIEYARQAIWYKPEGGKFTADESDKAGKGSIAEQMNKKFYQISGGDDSWILHEDRIMEWALMNAGKASVSANVAEAIEKYMNSKRFQQAKGQPFVAAKKYAPSPEELRELENGLREIDESQISEEEKDKRRRELRNKINEKRTNRILEENKASEGGVRDSTKERDLRRFLEAKGIVEQVDADPEKYNIPQEISSINNEAERMLRTYQWVKYDLKRGETGIKKAMEEHNKVHAEVVQVLNGLLGQNRQPFDLQPNKVGGWQNTANSGLLRDFNKDYSALVEIYKKYPKKAPIPEPVLNAVRKVISIKQPGNPYFLIPEMFDPGKYAVSAKKFQDGLSGGMEVEQTGVTTDEGASLGGGDIAVVELDIGELEETVVSTLKEKGLSDDDIKEEIAIKKSYVGGDKRAAYELILDEYAPEILEQMKNKSRIAPGIATKDDRQIIGPNKEVQRDYMPQNPAAVWKRPSELIRKEVEDDSKAQERVPDDQLEQALADVKTMMQSKNDNRYVPKEIKVFVNPNTQLSELNPAQIMLLRKFMVANKMRSRLSEISPSEAKGINDNQYKTLWRNSLNKLLNLTYPNTKGLLKEVAVLLVGNTPVQDTDGQTYQVAIPKGKSTSTEDYPKQKLINDKAIDLWFRQNKQKFANPIPELKSDPGSPMRRFKTLTEKILSEMLDTLISISPEEYSRTFETKIAKDEMVRMLRVAKFSITNFMLKAS